MLSISNELDWIMLYIYDVNGFLVGYIFLFGFYIDYYFDVFGRLWVIIDSVGWIFVLGVKCGVIGIVVEFIYGNGICYQ